MRACPPGVLKARRRPSLIHVFRVGVETGQCDAAWPVVSEAREPEFFGFFGFFTWAAQFPHRAHPMSSSGQPPTCSRTTPVPRRSCGRAVVLLAVAASFAPGKTTTAQGRR